MFLYKNLLDQLWWAGIITLDASSDVHPSLIESDEADSGVIQDFSPEPAALTCPRQHRRRIGRHLFIISGKGCILRLIEQVNARPTNVKWMDELRSTHVRSVNPPLLPHVGLIYGPHRYSDWTT
jgi:hypothetical protein